MFNKRFCSPSRLARQLGAGLLCAGLATPLWAAENITLCFENKMVLPWRTLAHEGLNFELLKRVEARLPVKFAYQRWPSGAGLSASAVTVWLTAAPSRHGTPS